MLQPSVQILVIIQLLRGSECQDSKQFDEEITLPANIRNQSLAIIDCFIAAVNISWEFSDEQGLNVPLFQNITYEYHHTCDGNSKGIFQCNYPLVDHLSKASHLKNESHHKEREYYNNEMLTTNGIEHYEEATELRRQATQVMKELVHQIRYIKKEAAARNEFRILTDNCSLTFLDMDNLFNLTMQYTTEYNEMRSTLEISRLWTYTLRGYPLQFTFGMLGNGLLLLIFVRHPKSRMGPNVILVNLTVSDTLYLVVNIATDYCKMRWGFPFGIEVCYVYNFAITLNMAASVYSMTFLSFSRYIAVTAKFGSSYNRLLTSMPVMLTAVWVLSAVVAIPDTLTSEMNSLVSGRTVCICDNLSLNIICDFLFISFLPLIAIACFYVAASRRLRKSVRMMPGQALGQERVKMARERGAKILPGLIFVFAITYLPFYTFFVIDMAFELDFRKSLTSDIFILYFVVYFLSNLNAILNPVALYLTSGMFRRYMNNYITLGLTTGRLTCVANQRMERDVRDNIGLSQETESSRM